MSSTFEKRASRDLVAVSEAKFSRLKWRMLLAAMFCYLFFYTGRQTFGFAIPGIQEDLGLSKTTLGSISGAMLWCYAAGQMVNGNLADKFGGRRLMAAGAVLSTILNWCTSFAVGSKSLAFFWGANGFTQAMGFPSGGRVISNWWGPHERGKSFGFYLFAAGLSSVLAFVTSTIVVDTLKMDWQWIFRIPVLLMLVGGITFMWWPATAPRPPESLRPSPTPATRNTSRRLLRVDTTRSLARYRAVLRNPKIWSTGVTIGFQNAARYGLLIWVPVYFLGKDWKEGAVG